MIAYANAQAETEESRVSFQVMDITHPMDFPPASFDLINGRFLLALMKKEQWPILLAECFRLLKPGGTLRITEQESGFSNNEIYQRYMNLWGTAWRTAGHAFAHTRAYIGVTVVLKPLMREAGFVDPKHRPISVDLSTGEPVHQETLENLTQALKLATPFLLKLGVTTQKEINELYRQMEGLIGTEDFCAYWFLQTIWAQKPDL